MGIFDKLKKNKNTNNLKDENKQLDKEEIKQNEKSNVTNLGDVKEAEQNEESNVTNLGDVKEAEQNEEINITNLEDIKKAKHEKIQEALSEAKLLEIIKDENIPMIKSEDGNVIFRRDYDNKRIILDNHIIDILTRNNQLDDCIDYLKEKDLIDYITVFAKNNEKVLVFDFYIKNQKTYLVPMNYVEELDMDILPDDKIHYTKDALDLEIKLGNKIEESDPLGGKEMRFCSIKNPNTNEEFLPLFKTKEELRIIYPNTKYRISEITYKEAITFAKEFKGIVFRPTVESFVIANEVARCFSGISEYKEPYVDYRKYTEGEKTLEEKIQKIGTLERGSKEADLYYKGILQNIYDLDKLYISLNKDDYDEENGVSTPLALTKDGEPAIYMFSQAAYGNNWAEHYNNCLEDKTPLVGCVSAEKNFDSIFSIAQKLGIEFCMLNEGETMIGFSIKLFMEVNNITSDMIMRLPKEDAVKVLQNKAKEVSLKFNKYSVIGTNEVTDSTEYYELKLH